MRNYINEKIWFDPEVSNYVMLDVTEEVGEQEAMVVDGVPLLPKDEYHVTLVAAGKITDGDPDRAGRLIEDTGKYLLANPDTVKLNGLSDERFVCRDKYEATLIAPARITGIERIRAIAISHVVDYKPAFPHVTLLKNEKSPYGIGLNSLDDFRSLYRKHESN